VPTPAELRFLVYTSLAYGAQGISYYVLSYRNHSGGAIDGTGAPTPLFEPMARLNGEFVRLVRATSGLSPIGVYHVGAQPEGTSVLPLDASIQARVPSGRGSAGRGLVLTLFGTGGPAGATHAFVVNANHDSPVGVVLRGRTSMESLALDDGRWVPAERRDMVLTLAPGDGRLVRVRRD
jgi:hypothetical protein